MVKEIREVGRGLSEQDIVSLELKIGRLLPPEYKEFLFRNNGGRPVPMYFPIIGLFNNPVGQVLDFFGIDDPVESCRVDWNFAVYGDRVPNGMLPIATDGGGNLICISLDTKNLGAVYFWDHNQEMSMSSTNGLYEIAPNLRGFLESFFDYNPLDLE